MERKWTRKSENRESTVRSIIYKLLGSNFLYSEYRYRGDIITKNEIEIIRWEMSERNERGPSDK